MRTFALCLLMILGACATPAPTRPAMAPAGQNGDFGYSERDLGPDRVEVTYRGAAIRVSAGNPRADARVQQELDKAHDLALWRAAQIAKTRSMVGIRIEQETRNSDIDVQTHPIYRPGPMFGPFWPSNRRYYGWHGPFYDDGYYDVQRWATARAVVSIVILLSPKVDASDPTLLPVDATIDRLSKARAQSMY
jgi:hypothetical protein